jgi:hypothetical protein
VWSSQMRTQRDDFGSTFACVVNVKNGAVQSMTEFRQDGEDIGVRTGRR